MNLGTQESDGELLQEPEHVNNASDPPEAISNFLRKTSGCRLLSLVSDAAAIGYCYTIFVPHKQNAFATARFCEADDFPTSASRICGDTSGIFGHNHSMFNEVYLKATSTTIPKALAPSHQTLPQCHRSISTTHSRFTSKQALIERLGASAISPSLNHRCYAPRRERRR